MTNINLKGTTFSVSIVPFLMILLLGTLDAQDTNEDYRFRPAGEYDEMVAKKTPYEEFLEDENIPVITGWAADLYKVKLRPWRRMGPGVTGAYLILEGAGGAIDNYAMELPVGGKTKPERHVFEEQVIVLSGQGEFHVWQNDPEKKAIVPFQKGSVLAPPMNTWHQFLNTGDEPVRVAGETDLPLRLDLYRNRAFIFDNPFQFTDRYAGDPDYFDPENSKDYNSNPDHHSLSVVNFIRNAWAWRLFHAGQGYGDTDRHFLMADNSMPGHVEQFPQGTYERGHRHGPGATIILLSGTGHSLLWPNNLGETPWKDGKGDKVHRVDWGPGVIFVPPLQHYHQHFNTGTAPARFIRLGGAPGNQKYKLRVEDVLSTGKNTMIRFREEDPYIRQHFEEELAQHGAKIRMPPMETLIRLERESGGEMLGAPVAADGSNR